MERYDENNVCVWFLCLKELQQLFKTKKLFYTMHGNTLKSFYTRLRSLIVLVYSCKKKRETNGTRI